MSHVKKAIIGALIVATTMVTLNFIFSVDFDKATFMAIMGFGFGTFYGSWS